MITAIEHKNIQLIKRNHEVKVKYLMELQQHQASFFWSIFECFIHEVLLFLLFP